MSIYAHVPVSKCHAVKKHIESCHGDDTDGQTEVSVAQFKHSLSMKSGKYYYGVQIETGKQLCAGTHGCVYVSLVGNKGQTGKVTVQGAIDAVFKSINRDTIETLTIVSDKDLGDVLVVTVGCDADADLLDDWYVSSVAVVNIQTDAVEHFPCYHWIGRHSSVSFTANTTTLKDVADSEILLEQRAEQLAKRQELYHWQPFPDLGMPSGILDSVLTLPADEQFGAMKNFEFYGGAMAGFTGLKLETFVTADDLHAYEMLADTLGPGGKRPLYQAGRWTSDVEFGRQMLNGVNPIVIEKFVKIPSNFPVSNDLLKPFLVRGLTLEEEMNGGHVYICDLKIMDGLETRGGYFNVAPICLLYVNGSGQLVPIAIQLKQGVKDEDKDNNPIFMPSDHWIDWLRAKIYYQSAHGQFHELFTHYTSCHATMEAFAVGTQRNLPDPHPIFKLLRPHLRYTMAINTRARDKLAGLINDGGLIDQIFGIGGPGRRELMRRAGKIYNIHTSNIKHYAKKRGVDNPDQLPGYYYRDDGFKVWDALEEYASDIINEFYQSDDDVKQDKELQKWAYDIHANGFPAHYGESDGHGFPSSISSRGELCDLCTLIMFTGSAQHASVNFRQYYIYQYVPNAPFGVRRPPPVEKGVADFQDLLETLPDHQTTVKSIGTTHLLSQYSEAEEFLGDYKARFREKKAIRMIERFKKSLRGISGDVLQRNQTIDMPYTGMLPEKIPNSITI